MYGCQMHSTYAYHCWAKSLLASCYIFISCTQPSRVWLIKSVWCMWVCGQTPPRIGKNFKFFSELRIKSCKLLEGPPRIGKNFKFISEFRIKSCGMDPLDLTLGGNLWKSTFACTVQWCMQICHKPFPISWRPLENVISLYVRFLRNLSKHYMHMTQCW